MAPHSTVFIEAVWARLGATGPTDFARKLGLGVDGLQKIRRWRQGGRLDYEDVMQMLEVAGWFTMDQAAEEPLGEVMSHDPLEVLAAAVVRLARGQELIAEALDVQLDEPEQTPTTPQPHATRPKRKAR